MFITVSTRLSARLVLADDGALLVDFSYRWHIPNL